MKEFFNDILSTLCRISSADKHQKIIFCGSIIVYLLLGLVFGYLSSIIFTAFIGLVYELTYCYVLYKEIEIFGRYIRIPDYSTFKKEFNILDTKVYHDFSIKNMYFCFNGILIGIIIRIIFMIL